MNLITSFSHIYLPVRNLDESIDFYTQNFGFRLLRKYLMSEGAEPSAYVELADVLLELTQTRRPLPVDEDRVELRIGLTVTDLEAVWKDLMSRGIGVIREPFDARTFWGRQAQVKDANGYGISLREWAAPDNPRFPDWQPKHEGVTRLA